MIEQTVEDLAAIVGTRPACRALGAAPATICCCCCRRRRPLEPRPARPRAIRARALSEPERQAVLGVLHSEWFVDCSPVQVWATLLDEGSFISRPSACSTGLLAARHGGVRERRKQFTHPAYAKPDSTVANTNQQGDPPAATPSDSAAATTLDPGHKQ
jgi:putative transposase